ncbi:MAG TPA: hypothetical protein VFS21_03280 [Roseiflexaceae bacterium]|nr:hypothetical protein [Roseiflexaceae bacterium]
MKRLQITIELAKPEEIDALERTARGYGATLENTSRAGRVTEVIRAEETAPAFVKYRALVTLPADTSAERAEAAITRAVTRAAGVIEAVTPATAPQKAAQQPLRASEGASAGAGVAAFAKAAGCSAEEAARRLSSVGKAAAAEIAVRAALGELDRPSGLSGGLTEDALQRIEAEAERRAATAVQEPSRGLPTEADLRRLGI